MQKPDVFPRFIQLCFKLLHISGFNYFTWQRIPVIYHPVGETELPQIQPAWLLHDFHSMNPWPRVSLEFIVKKSLASRSSMPVMMRNVWIMSMRLLLYFFFLCKGLYSWRSTDGALSAGAVVAVGLRRA